MLNYCNDIVVLLIYLKYSDSEEGSGRNGGGGGGGGRIGVKNKTETVNCKNAKSIKISYVNNSKLVADIVINIIFVCEIFVVWSCYTIVADGMGPDPFRPRVLQREASCKF